MPTSSDSSPHYSVSDLIAWRTCPFLYITKRRLAAGPPPGAALRLGTLAHTLYEAHATHAWQSVLDATNIQALTLDSKDLDKYLRIRDAMATFAPPWKRTSQRELALRMPLGDTGAFIVGRLDGICETQDSGATLRWSEQLKTIDMSHDAATAIDKVRRSHHELTYNVLWHKNHPDLPLSGIALVLARKRPTKADPLVFSTHLIDLDPEEARALYAPIHEAFHQLHFFTLRHLPLPGPEVLHDYNSCHTPFGTCAFKPHCHHGVRIDALDLVPAPPRYSPEDFLS